MRDPIVIIGGGIGGLTAAIALQQRDVPCVVYERAPALNEIGAGVALWPATLRVLDRFGLGDAVRELAGPWKVGGVLRDDGTPVVTYTVEEFSRVLGEPTAGVHRGELQAVLLGALPDEVVRTSHECASVSVEGDRARVQFVNGSEVVAPVVIGADGRRSRVRASVFGDRPLHDLKAMGWRGTAPIGGDLGWGDFAGELWGDTGRFGILPISRNRVTWFSAVKRPHSDDHRQEILDRFGHWMPPIRELVEATPDDAIWFDRIDDRFPTRRWVKGPVALLGDAAHPMSPDLGQGACQAIMDAAVLAEEIERGPDIRAALRRYERRRRLRAGAVTLTARASTVGARTERRALVALRCRVAAHAPRNATLKQIRLLSAGP